MRSMDAMMQDQQFSQMGGAQSQEGQMEMMMNMMVQQARSSDELFMEEGVEEDQLNASITALNLQQDPDFMQMVNENMMKVMAKAQAAQGGAPGGAMGAPGGMGGMPGGMF